MVPTNTRPNTLAVPPLPMNPTLPLPPSSPGRSFQLGELLALALALTPSPALASDSQVFIGTYTGPQSKGIYCAQFDSKTGALTAPELAAELRSPSFLAISPDGNLLFAVNEVADFDGKRSGAVSVLRIEPGRGKLRLINQQPSGGGGPCHVMVDRTGRHVLVANYGGGSVSVFPVRPDGSLGEATAFVQHQGTGPNPRRQEGPHAHGIYLDEANRYAIVPDLGLDKLLIYRFDAQKGALAAADSAFLATAPGAGPRHFAFQPQGTLACVINELHSTLSTLRYEPSQGRLTLLDTISTLPVPVEGNSTAEVFFHPNGRFVYGSNRGHNSIAVLAVDPSTGKLTSVQHELTRGKTPRSFAIDPTGRWLLAANQGSDSMTVFALDPQSGRLRYADREVKGVGSPVCLVFAPR